jgi:hypothetical protein
MMHKSIRFPAVLLAAATLAGGCAAFDTPNTYNRHRLSDITEPRDGMGGDGGDVLFFDVSVTAEFPDNNAAAEATRMTWLAEWLESRAMCPAGHEVVNRRPFDFMEHNPARRDLRYEVRCKAAPAG